MYWFHFCFYGKSIQTSKEMIKAFKKFNTTSSTMNTLFQIFVQFVSRSKYHITVTVPTFRYIHRTSSLMELISTVVSNSLPNLEKS